MMRAILVLFLLAPAALAFRANAQCPLSTAITVDGAADEWPMNWESDQEKTFSYNVCVDEQNLYVRVKTGEFFTKRKLAAFGFTLWFDPNGKKKRTYGVKFPAGGAEAEERMTRLNKEAPQNGTVGEKADFQKYADKELISNLEVMELIGLTEEPITSTRSGITNGIKVAISADAASDYVYEAVIPLRSFRLTRAKIEEMAVGFETGKFEAPKQKPTTKNSPLAGDMQLSPAQMSRLQGYENMQGNPKLIYPTTSWTKLSLKK